jgi:acyl carrier protein
MLCRAYFQLFSPSIPSSKPPKFTQSTQNESKLHHLGKFVIFVNQLTTHMISKEQIIMDLQEIFCEVFELDTVTIDSNTSALDIDEWDSLTHIQLVVSVEKKYNIRFNSAEIQTWENVGKMIDSILLKLG